MGLLDGGLDPAELNLNDVFLLAQNAEDGGAREQPKFVRPKVRFLG